MSDTSPNMPNPGEPLPEPPPRRFRRPLKLGEYLAWAVVIIAVALAAGEVALQQFTSSAAGAGTPADAAAKREMIPFYSQYAVGVHALAGRSGSGVENVKELQAELDKVAMTGEDRLKAAIVSGELIGRDEAIRRLAQLGTEFPQITRDISAARACYDKVPLAPEQSEAFHEKYRWFADLAQSNDAPETDPLRSRVLTAAYFRLMTVAGMVLGVLGWLTAGLILLIIALVMLARKRIRLACHPLPEAAVPADRSLYVQGFAVYLGGMVGLGLLLHFVLPSRFTVRSPLMLLATELGFLGTVFAAGVVYPLLRGQSLRQWREALGLTRGRGLLREAFSGFVGYTAGLPLLALGMILSMVLMKLTDHTMSHPIDNILSRGWQWILVAFILASIFAPISEELMFRGALFSHLRERFGWLISSLLVAFIFAIIHPQGVLALPVLGSIAIVLAGIREWRGSIVGCIFAHGLHNTVTLLLALALR